MIKQKSEKLCNISESNFIAECKETLAVHTKCCAVRIVQ